MFRLAYAVPLGLLLASRAIAQQDDPFETVLYNVEFLTVSAEDHPGEAMGISNDSIGTVVAAMELAPGLLTGEDIVGLIKANVAEDSWDHVSAGMSYSQGVLTVTNRRSIHEKINQYLNYWRGYVGRMVVMDAAIVSIDPELLTRIRAGGNPERPAILPPEHYKQVLETASDGKFAELARSSRITAHPGQRVHLGTFDRQQYLRDYDVQIATASVALAPIVDTLTTGFCFDVRPYLEPFASGITMEVRADLSEPEAITDRRLKISRDLFHALPFENAGAAQGGAIPRGPAISQTVEFRLQLPRLTLDHIRTTLTVKSGETAIVGTVFRRGRVLLFLITASIVAADEKPSPEPVFDEQRLVRLFDISPLTRGVQDWAGPILDVRSTRGAGGPLTGATFTLEEAAVLMSAEDVASMIRNRVARDSWENSRNSIGTAQRGTLVVRQKPEVLKEIERFLSTLLTARAQMITTEAVVIGFKKGVRAEWERDIPALAPGGYFVEQERFEKLLLESCKGQKVRLVETSEITGFPQERVHALRSIQESQLSQYEPQVSSFAAMHDPIVSVFSQGFVLDVRPHYVHGNEQIGVDFRARMQVGDLRDLDLGTPSLGPLQAAQSRKFSWNSNVACVKGKWSLVAIERVGRGNDAEDWAVFVRARRNVLK